MAPIDSWLYFICIYLVVPIYQYLLLNFIIGCSLVLVSKKFQSVFGMPSIAQSRIVYDRATKHIDHTRTRGDNNNYLVRQNEETLQSLGIFNLIIHVIYHISFIMTKRHINLHYPFNIILPFSRCL